MLHLARCMADGQWFMAYVSRLTAGALGPPPGGGLGEGVGGKIIRRIAGLALSHPRQLRFEELKLQIHFMFRDLDIDLNPTHRAFSKHSKSCQIVYPA